MSREDNVLSGLKAIGLAPGDIDVVICSHLHTDHCGCNAFFGKATMLSSTRSEIEIAKCARMRKGRPIFDADWDHAGARCRRSRGSSSHGRRPHRAGAASRPHAGSRLGALVELDRSGRFLLASDALSVRENLDRDIIPRNTWNAEACARSFDEIRRLERAGYQVICGHDAPQWERLRKGAEAYD